MSIKQSAIKRVENKHHSLTSPLKRDAIVCTFPSSLKVVHIHRKSCLPLDYASGGKTASTTCCRHFHSHINLLTKHKRVKKEFSCHIKRSLCCVCTSSPQYIIKGGKFLRKGSTKVNSEMRANEEFPQCNLNCPAAHFPFRCPLMRFLCESDDFIVFELETFQFHRSVNPSFAKIFCWYLRIGCKWCWIDFLFQSDIGRLGGWNKSTNHPCIIFLSHSSFVLFKAFS